MRDTEPLSMRDHSVARDAIKKRRQARATSGIGMACAEAAQSPSTHHPRTPHGSTQPPPPLPPLPTLAGCTPNKPNAGTRPSSSSSSFLIHDADEVVDACRGPPVLGAICDALWLVLGPWRIHLEWEKEVVCLAEVRAHVVQFVDDVLNAHKPLLSQSVFHQLVARECDPPLLVLREPSLQYQVSHRLQVWHAVYDVWRNQPKHFDAPTNSLDEGSRVDLVKTKSFQDTFCLGICCIHSLDSYRQNQLPFQILHGYSLLSLTVKSSLAPTRSPMLRDEAAAFLKSFPVFGFLLARSFASRSSLPALISAVVFRLRSTFSGTTGCPRTCVELAFILAIAPPL
eukprot:CAMPEP_0181290052 /NCGR_PEP_ID=MMETSP1101-20121128/1213_1 /TAXON_ID=46948 /ORGANISM="Rhodomonas abbreviata, Strain Caron Lab Isolate" /LENGTH=340 /DNA_ID=CAMNT_0023394321 /DNA_START=112 /DNA_END=1133 /DNA_ORIENTATION=+